MLDPNDSIFRAFPWFDEFYHATALPSPDLSPACGSVLWVSWVQRVKLHLHVEWAPFLLDRCRNWTGIYRYICVYIYIYAYIYIYIYIDTYTYVCHIFYRMFASTFSVLLRTKNLLLLLPGSSTCWEIRNPSMWWPCLRNGAPGISRDVMMWPTKMGV